MFQENRTFLWLVVSEVEVEATLLWQGSSSPLYLHNYQVEDDQQ